NCPAISRHILLQLARPDLPVLGGGKNLRLGEDVPDPPGGLPSLDVVCWLHPYLVSPVFREASAGGDCSTRRRRLLSELQLSALGPANLAVGPLRCCRRHGGSSFPRIPRWSRVWCPPGRIDALPAGCHGLGNRGRVVLRVDGGSE